jgi:hypothetical protein
MPQPLSRVRRDAGVVLTPAAIAQRPHLGMLAMQTVATGSQTEQVAGQILSTLLGADLAIGLAMYEALSGAEAKRAALEGAAKAALLADDFQLFRAVVSVTRSARQRRNEFAHHIWGFSPQLDNALLLVDPRDVLQSAVRIREWALELTERIRKGEIALSQLDPNTVPKFVPPERVMVYRERDFQRCSQDAFLAFSRWSMLGIALQKNPGADQMRALLRSQPPIERELHRTSG